MGILICGLNGAGKSTLGKVLAEKLNFHFIDIEDLYFDKNTSDNTYQNPRTRDEVINLLNTEVKNHPDFVFAAVKGDYGKDVVSKYNYVVMLEVPQNIRSQRVRDRSFQKFGNRMLAGGDLYCQEESFFRMAESRQDNYIEKWIQTVKCPIIRIDGTKPIEENVEYIIGLISI